MSDSTKVQAFVDSASLHDAFAALEIRDPRMWTEWHHRCLVDVTYLLLFNNVRIVPGPLNGAICPVPGDERDLISDLPALRALPGTPQAEAKVQRWLARADRPLRTVWGTLLAQPEVEEWSALRRELFWARHIQSHSGLFDPQYIPAIGDVLNVPEGELRRVHSKSQDPAVVQKWAKGADGRVSHLADNAYQLSGLIRGKFHEYVARESGLQLAAHPHRALVAGRTRQPLELPTTNSAQCFVRLLIGSALLETKRRRVPQWRSNVLKAREALNRRVALLPDLSETDAEALAVQVAKRIGIPAAPRWQQRLLSAALETNVAIYAGLLLGPWALGVTAATRLYKLARGRSVADELTDALISEREFRRLGRAVPGRITRALATGRRPTRC